MRSDVLNCDMVFSLYEPPQAEKGPVPVLFWLSGMLSGSMQCCLAHRANSLGFVQIGLWALGK